MRLGVSGGINNDAILTTLISGSVADAGDLVRLVCLANVVLPGDAAFKAARNLLEEFGTLAKVLYAPLERLWDVEGTTNELVNLINLTRCSAEHIAHEQVNESPILGCFTEVIRYIRVKIGHSDIENFHVLFLNHAHRLMKDEVLHTGGINHTPVYPYVVTRRAVMIGASAVIIAHNHPSDDCTPSPADIFITKSILEALIPVGIAIHDHIIVSPSGHYSFRSAGLL